MSEKLKSLNTQCFCPVNKTNKQNLGYLFSFIEKKKRKLHHKWSVSAFSHEPCRVPPERMQWILLSENWSPLTVLPPSIRGAGDLCRPQPTGEQSACVSFCPGVSFFCLDHILYCVWSLIVCSVSRVEAFTVDPSRQSSAIAAKAQCRPLTWWMVPDNKPWALHSAFHVTAVLIAADLQSSELSVRPVNSSPLEARRCNKLNDNNRTTLREHVLVKLLNINQCHWTNSCLQQIWPTEWSCCAFMCWCNYRDKRFFRHWKIHINAPSSGTTTQKVLLVQESPKMADKS